MPVDISHAVASLLEARRSGRQVAPPFALPDRDAVYAIQDGVARGVSKTPTVFVNGQPFIETFTVQEISKAIEDAVKQAR